MPWNANRAISGSRTWKLNESVPISAIAASGIRSSGVWRTWRSAARSWPGSRPARLPRCSSSGLINRRAISIAPKDRALSRKHSAIPIVAITAPANAGPMIRADWMITLLRLTAFTTRSRPTSSITKLWRAGLSMALTAPRTNTSASTIHTVTSPEAVSAHSASAGSAISVWVIASSWRLETRSASTPPHAPANSIGVNCSAAVRPTAVALSVSRRTSHISPTVCIQLPLIETIWPVKYRR